LEVPVLALREEASVAVQDIYQNIYTFSVVLTPIPGFWLAWRLLRRISWIFPRLAPDFEGESHWLILVAWLVLGSLFTAPFVDLVQVAQEMTSFIISSYMGGSAGQTIFSFWGSAPLQLDYIFSISLTLIVYILGYRLGVGLYRSGKLAFLEPFQLQRMDWILLLLAFTSLVNGVTNRFVGNLVWLQLPGNPFRGALGFVIGWIIAVILIGMILVFMDRQLLKLEEELEDQAGSSL
jgi:hypothetical protein